MFICSECSATLLSIKALFLHLEFFHGCTESSTYICSQNKCYQFFSSKKTFRDHLSRSHRTHNYIHNVRPEAGRLKNFEDSNLRCSTNFNQSSPPKEITEQLIFENDDVNGCENKNLILNVDESFEKIESDADDFKFLTAKFVAKLYSIPSLPRSIVDFVFKEVDKLVNFSLLPQLQIKLLSNLELRPQSEDSVENVKSLFLSYFDTFQSLNSEYKRFSYFKEKNYLLEVENDLIGEELCIIRDRKTGKKIFENLPVSGQYISIKNLLKWFLEIPGNFKLLIDYKNYLEKLDPRLKVNLTQCTLWEIIKNHFVGKFVVPLIFYYDDFNPDVPYGPHSGFNKIGAVYYTIPLFPPEFLARLSSIFIAYLFNTNDRSSSSLERIFEHLYDELKDLESEGLVISIEGIDHEIFFALTLFVGDNLAVHALYGYNESFSCNYPCQFCKAHKKLIEKDWRLRPELKRTVENYENDVLLNDPKSTGVKNNCIFNLLKSFHSSVNLTNDIMHGLLLGTCRYDLALLFIKLIENRVITLEIINSKIKCFDYGPNEKDKPVEISSKQLKNKSINLYASQMLTLVKFLPLILGNSIPSDNKYWEWFLILRKLFDILFSNSLQVELATEIDSLVEEFLQTRLELFPDETLKPKHHYLLHYSEIFLTTGPFVANWCMRFEGVHRVLMQYAKNSKNRINLPVSLATKYQLSMISLFMEKNPLKDSIKYGPIKERSLTSLPNYKYFKNYIPLDDFSDTVKVIKWIKINGRRYEELLFLLYKNDDIFPEFVEIMYIIENEKIFLFCRIWKADGFVDHLHAYRINCDFQWVSYPIENFKKFKPLKKYIVNGDSFVMCYE